MAQVILYRRPGCHLCDDAAQMLGRLSGEMGFSWREVNIEEDEKLLARYHLLIPVIAVDGQPLLHAPVEEGHLRVVLAEQLRGPAA